MWKFLKDRAGALVETQQPAGGNEVKILKKGSAARVIFFYPGEEGTYIDSAQVTLYENGIVHIKSNNEESTTMLQNCEILWQFEVDAETNANKVRLLKPKNAADASAVEAAPESSGSSKSTEGKPSGKGSSKNPELR